MTKVIYGKFDPSSKYGLNQDQFEKDVEQNQENYFNKKKYIEKTLNRLINLDVHASENKNLIIEVLREMTEQNEVEEIEEEVKETGTKIYYPEMNEKEPEADIIASLSYSGKHYNLMTKLELKGRGITLNKLLTKDHLTTNKYVGYYDYTVTIAAYKKLEKEYTISQKIYLD